MRPAPVVIIGAGVMGASVAFHLAVRGWRDLLLVDRSDGPGQGSTGVATGGFRAQYGTAINVRLSLLAREKLLRFRDEIGVDPGYLPAGYLWLAETRAELDDLLAGLEVQRVEGLHEATEVSVEDIGLISPAVRRNSIMGGTFCPTDGFITPLQVLNGYLTAALRAGARVEWQTAVTGLVLDENGSIVAVETTRGRIATGAVVNACGAWAAELALHAVALPAAADHPGDHGPLARDGRVLLLWPTPGVPGKPFDVSVDSEWLAKVTTMARSRVPVLHDVAIDVACCRAGLYEMSPDRHALLGPAPGCDNLFLINGSSGHGVMHAPALGQLLAELMSDGGASSLDVTALRPSRFLEGQPNPSAGPL